MLKYVVRGGVGGGREVSIHAWIGGVEGAMMGWSGEA